MPSYRVILSRRTFADLDAILDYIAQLSPRGAIAVIDRLWTAMKALENLPHRYPIVQGRKRPRRAVRKMPVGSYLVYYRILEEHLTVRIVAIHHAARRQPRTFD